jgi:2-keto-4-pentenoate hydratase/2-oxohepta-3-ene-1,7-dioic acid hydratase in catechol pathway
MRWCRFQAGDRSAYGIIEGDSVAEVTGSPFETHVRTSTKVPLSRVKLLVPVIPPTFYAAGVNYREHVTEMAERRGEKPKFPPQADVGYRASNALVATDEPIVIPQDATEEVQYEGELVVVIGKRCKRVSEADALDCVFGYTIGNDVSERDWQGGPNKDLQWWRAKGADTFGPLGPAIVQGIDYGKLALETRLNGKVVQKQSTSDLIFDLPSIVSWISQYVTLGPGDLIYTGTPGSTSRMNPGDVVEVDIEGIGVLRNRVAA